MKKIKFGEEKSGIGKTVHEGQIWSKVFKWLRLLAAVLCNVPSVWIISYIF